MAHRPSSFDGFVGQTHVVENLRISVRAALRQGKPLPHVLLTGPAGLGKTTLAQSVLPSEMQVPCCAINCSSVEKPQELLHALCQVAEGSILFLDEIHCLIPAAREHLLTAMEDQRLSVKIGDGPDAQIMNVDLPQFTIVGATTREGLLDGPLRSRFRLAFTLLPYDEPCMREILIYHADCHGFKPVADDPAALDALIGPSHGVARLGVNLVESVIDTILGADQPTDRNEITAHDCERTLDRLGYVGPLTQDEVRYLRFLHVQAAPVGLKTLAAALDEQQSTVEEVYEPWLLRSGYLSKTGSGRALTAEGHQLVRDLA